MRLERQRTPRAIGRELAKALSKVCPVKAWVSITPDTSAKAYMLDRSFARGKAAFQPIELSNFPALTKAISGSRLKLINSAGRSKLGDEINEILDIKRAAYLALLPIGSDKSFPAAVLLIFGKSSKAITKAQKEKMSLAGVAAKTALRALILKQEGHQKPSEVHALFFDHATDGLIIIDSKARVGDVNHAFIKLMGYSRRELVGRRYQSFLTPETRARGRDYFRKFRRGELVDKVELGLTTKTGSVKDVLVGVARVPALDDRAMLTVHDISESRKLERELLRSKEFFENLIQSSVDAIIACDMKGRILTFNEAAEKISGYRAEDVIGGLNVTEFYAPGAAKDVMRKLRSKEYGGVGKLETCHYNIVSKDGEEIPINVSSALIYEDGKEVASVGIFQDLRERIAVEKQLREAQDKLIDAEKQRAVTELSGATAHELNQPLTSILGYVELLQRRMKTSEIPNKILNSLTREAERMAEMVRKVGSITTYKTKDYVGRGKIIDLEMSSTGEPLSSPRYEELFRYMRDVVLETDASGKIVYVNPEAVNVLEYESPEDLTGRPLEDIFGDKVELDSLLEQVKEHGHVTKKLIKAKSRSEKIIYMEVSGGKVIDRDGKSHGTELFCRDVTDRLNTEKALQEAKAFSENIVDNAPIGIVTLDKDGTILSANRASAEIMGVEDNSFILGQNIFKMGNVREAGLTDLIKRGLMGERISAPSIKVTTLLGKEVTIKVEGVPLRDDAGRVTGGIALIEDLTERAETEALAKTQRQRLETLGRIIRHSSAAESPDQFLLNVIEDLKIVISHDAIVVSFLDEEAKNLLIKAYYLRGKDVSAVEPRLFDLEKTVLKEIIESKKAFKADDVEKAPPGLDTDYAIELGIKSGIITPIIASGKVIGTLNIGSYSKVAYTDADAELLEQVAHELGHALQNANLLEDLRTQNALLARRTEQLKIIHDLATQLEVTLPEKDLVQRYTYKIRELFPYRHVMIRLINLENGGTKMSVAYAGDFPEEAGSAADEKLGMEAEKILKEIVSKGDDLKYIEDITEEAGYAAELPGAKSAAIIPFVFRNELIGVLKVESHVKAAFKKEDLDILVILSREMATSIGNVRLFDESAYLRNYQEELIDNANVLIMAFDTNGRITTFNKAMERLLGLNKEEALGRDILELLKGLDVDHETLKKIGSLKHGRVIEEAEVEMTSACGDRVKIIVNSSAISNLKGEFKEIVLVGQDMTRMEALELNLVQADKMASIGQMAAGFVHELSNPLTTISSYSDLLKRSLPKTAEKEHHKLDRITEAVSRIERLINSLMSYTRVSDGQKSSLNLNELAERSLSFTKFDISKADAEIVMEFEEELPHIQGIDTQLQQVLINLITNACHAIKEKGGGTLTVKTSSNENEVLMEIRDTGAGIDEKYLAKIFEPFFTTKSDGDGTGLGLSIVNEIVRRHHGEINISSAPGKGTSVFLKFPFI